MTSSYVVVIGLGGVGSHAASMLLRSGVGRLLLVDFDQVCSSFDIIWHVHILNVYSPLILKNKIGNRSHKFLSAFNYVMGILTFPFNNFPYSFIGYMRRYQFHL